MFALLLAIFLGCSFAQRSDVSLGISHTCMSTAGKAICFGNGVNGKLGNGQTSSLGDAPGEMSRLVPVVFAETLGFVQSIAAGESATCVHFEKGKMECFGTNDNGQLGIESTAFVGCGGSCLSVVALGGIEFGTPSVKVLQVSVGSSHSCALFANARVRW
jgi:hypothetical protein